MNTLPWDEAVALVRDAQVVVVVGHLNPDADALGSALGLAAAVRLAGARACATFDGDPFQVPPSLAWLPHVELLESPEQCPSHPDLVISVDCAAEDRLGRLLPLARAASAFLVIDHHRSNPGFGDVRLIDSDVPAAGVLVAELLDRAGLPWNTAIATDLYAAIASDTGGFRFAGTSSDTHRLAASLLDQGVDPEAVGRALFASRPLPVARLAAHTVAEAILVPTAVGGSGAMIALISQPDRAKYGVHYDDVESIITDLAAITAADVAVIAKQDDHGVWRVSMRSRGGTDVGALSTGRGGGGHRLAGGFSATADSAEAMMTELMAILGANSAAS